MPPLSQIVTRIKPPRLGINKIFVRPKEPLHFLLGEVATANVVELDEFRNPQLFAPGNIVRMKERSREISNWGTAQVITVVAVEVHIAECTGAIQPGQAHVLNRALAALWT